ncbi:hypothetical protein [Jatrophihabitans fulvus]
MTHPNPPVPGQYPQTDQPGQPPFHSGPVPPQPQAQHFPQQQFAPNQFPQGPQQGRQQFGPQPYGPPAGPPGAGLWTHIRRAVDWNVAQVVVSPKERVALEQAGIFDRLQGMFAWRRSSLMVALPVLLLSVILSVVDAAKADTEYLTGLGKFINWVPVISLVLVPVGCFVVITRWTELRRSSRTLLACWLVSIVLPMLAALAPVDVIADVDRLRAIGAQNGTLQAVEEAISGIRLSLAVQYALTLLPVVLSVPSGMLKGAARVKSLFPSSGLPGWFLVTIAPFYSLFTIVVFGLIEQIVGNGVLMVGVGVLAFTPWLFVIYRKVYSRPLSLAEARGELARASRLGGYLMWVAVAFIVIFLFTGKVGQQDVVGTDSDTSVFTVLDVSRTTIEVIARGIVAAVVFSTIFLGMIFAEWRTTTIMREDIRREHDREMRGLERYITDPRNGYGDVVLNGRPVPPGQ